MVHFSGDDSDVRDRPSSRWSCTAVNSGNEEHLKKLIHANRWTVIMKLCTELSVGFSALETILATLECHKVCARRAQRVLTEEHTDHPMQVCQDLLDCPSTPTVLSGFSAFWLPSIQVNGRRTTQQHYPDNDSTIISSQLWESGSPPLLQIFTSAACKLLFVAG
jgi:hypothetical protein